MLQQEISKDTKIGKGTRIFHFVNLYGCEIGENCVIGSFVEIQRGVKIGNNCKIEAGAYLPTGVEIEDGVFVGPRVCFTNDKKPRAINEDDSLKSASDWKLEKTVVKKGAAIGANSTILCGITIGEFATIGAGSIVTKDVPARATVYGNPARIVEK